MIADMGGEIPAQSPGESGEDSRGTEFLNLCQPVAAVKSQLLPQRKMVDPNPAGLDAYQRVGVWQGWQCRSAMMGNGLMMEMMRDRLINRRLTRSSSEELGGQYVASHSCCCAYLQTHKYLA